MAKDPMLWHGCRRVRVQPVKKAMRLPCTDCSQPPQDRRLLVVDGSGRGAATKVYCINCGKAYLLERAAEARRAVDVLATGTGHIRLP